MQVESTQTYPASLAQQRLWFLQQLQGNSTAYNVHVGLWLRGRLDLAALQSAYQEIVKRHDTLRTAFRLEAGRLVQVVREPHTARIPITDVTSATDVYAEAYRLAKEETETPFDLAQGSLVRARVMKVTPEDHVFLCTMHHIITDAWSLQLFAKELAQLYESLRVGTPSPLTPLPVSYGDFSEWQMEWFQSETVQQQIAYWKNALTGAPELLELPTDAPRPPEQGFRGATQIAPISNEVVQAIRQVANQHQATPFMVQLAVFKLLLYRYSRQPDVLVGVPVAGRNRVETEGLIGFFVNTLVLRDNLSGNPTFAELLAQVRETTLAALSNTDVPFEKIVEVLQPERNLSHNPIFQVMFATIKSAVRSHEFGNLTAFPYIVNTESSIFDLSMTLIDGLDEQWWAQIEYNTALFKQERITRMLEDYNALLASVGTSAERPILDYPVPSMPGPADLIPVASRDTVKRSQRNRRAGERRGKLHSATSAEEQFLVEVWRHVLQVSEVGVHDSFFDVGGHSLLAARLIAQIEEITGRRVPVSAIFRAPTIAEFAPLLREKTVAQR